MKNFNAAMLLFCLFSSQIIFGMPVFAAQPAVNKKVVQLLSQASQALCKMEYDKAIGKCDEILRAEPRCSGAFYLRGFAYRYKGDYDRAILDFTQSLKIDPKYTAAYYGRGLAFAYKGDYENAVSDLTAAVEIDPKYTDAYFTRARVYYDMGEFDKAWEDIHKAEALGLREDILYRGFISKLREESGRSQ